MSAQRASRDERLGREPGGPVRVFMPYKPRKRRFSCVLRLLVWEGVERLAVDTLLSTKTCYVLCLFVVSENAEGNEPC